MVLGETSVINFFLYSGMGVSLFIILIFLTRRPSSSVNKIVILFMVSLTFPMQLKLFSPSLSPRIVSSLVILRLAPLLYGPLLYLYIIFVTREKPKFLKQYLLHFLPFLIILTILLISNHTGPGLNILTKPNFGQVEEYRFSNPKFPTINHPPIPQNRMRSRGYTANQSLLVSILVMVSLFAYTAVIIVLLKKHNRTLSFYYSYYSILLNLSWLKWIIIVFSLSYSYVIGASFLFPHYFVHPLLDPFYAPDISTTFFLYTFSFFAIKQPVVFISENATPPAEICDKKRKYERSGLNVKDMEHYFDILENHMRSEKPYLDPQLTIVDLANFLEVPKHHVTEIINKRYNNNFFMYINSYRVEEAKERLSDIKSRDVSIICIAYDCGFNSKSTFNHVFKKSTDLTPSEFRKRQMKHKLLVLK